ncbi:MAG: heme lyase CcmF/NrfE family subunit [Dehalococcoidia bacterium]|nr:heme lyase CcmF/NrfE family subunit [Dehalococcoidia bacterium]
MAADVGQLSLLLALALSVYAAIASLLGAWRRLPELVQSGRYALYLAPLLLLVATLTLVAAFVNQDFSLQYVALHSNRAMQPIYTWVAFYAGNEGSLLYIAFVFSTAAAIAVALAPRSTRSALPYTSAVLMAVLVFFIAVMASMANPFAELSSTPPDGRGMNPLLTHAGMFFHPPMLMFGLVGTAIPFSFAMGHLLAGKSGDEWVDAGRLWALIVWTVLTVGLLLGAWWAYTILGWGGYWAWDPVENAGLLPFLPLTAFVHSIMVQKRRGVFRLWNVALVNVAFGLALYGMFMNRGGPIPSVHSFGQSTMGWVFLTFLGAMVAGSFAVFFWRYNKLKSATSLESPLSREAAFLVNNLLFLAIAFVVLWGVVFPLLSDVARNQTVTVARPFYDTVTGPLFLALLLFMAVGPLIRWRKNTGKQLRGALLAPLLVGLAVTAVVGGLGVHKSAPLLVVGISAGAAFGIFREWWHGTAAQHRRGASYPAAFLALLSANRPRYGGYIAHLGVVILAVSVAGSAYYSKQRDVALAPGQEATLGDYTLRYEGADVRQREDRTEYVATVQVFRNEKPLGTLQAGYTFYPEFSIAATRAGIRSTPAEDLYLIASEFAEDGTAVFRLHVNPLVMWMWVSGVLFVLGTTVSLWPHRSTVPARAPAASRSLDAPPPRQPVERS